MRNIKLVIPLAPDSLNKWQRSHWAKRARIKEEWDTEIAVALTTCLHTAALSELGEGACLPKPFERARVRISYFFGTNRLRDKDNYTPKVIMDGLKGRVIVDDSSDRIDLDWELLFSKNQPRTEILVEEIIEKC